MKRIVMCMAALSLTAFSAFAAPPVVDLAGAWQVTLADGTQAEVQLPGTLGDAKLGPAAEKAVYGALTPRHQYVGLAVYTKRVTVTPEMTGNYELFLERVMWQSTVSLDGQPVGSCDSLAAPHVYTLPAERLSPGEHTLTIAIDNRLIYPIGEKSHSYGDSMQTRWNGVIGQVVLRPENPLRKARVFAPCGEVVTVKFPEAWSARAVREVQATIEGVPSVRVAAEDPTTLALKVPGAKPWSEFDPQLYTLCLSWRGQTHRIRFGFRTFERRGNRVYLNGHPFFVRGNTENCHFPLTGYPAMDKATWLAIFRKLKGEGVNQIRCHTWATPQAAFDAADELGLLISPEVLWIDGWMTRDYPDIKGLGKGPKAVDDFVRHELFRILDAYGNAPSFYSLSVGNELGSSDFTLLGSWMEACKAYDNRHLYAASSARQISTGDDFLVTHAYPGLGMVREWRREGTDWDYESVYARTKLPTIAHEIGQWPVFPTFDREIPKYTGLLRPWNLEGLREASAKAGVLRFNEAYAHASLMTCLLMYKDEIESFLRTPSCAGLQLLGIQDYSGQGEALIGWFDSFYDRKPGAEAAVPVGNYFAPVACLARFPKYTWRANETFTAKLVIHNYSQRTFRDTLEWRLGSASGRVPVTVPEGQVATVYTLNLPLKQVTTHFPAKLVLTFGNNRWPIWVYPEAISAEVPPGIVFTDDLAEAQRAIAAGQRLLFDASGCANPKATLFSAFIPVYWGTTWFPGQRATTLGMVVQAQSPAFAAFPTEDWQDWQWKHLINGATTYRLPGGADAAPGSLSADFTPLAMPVVDFHKPALAAVLFEARIGQAKVLVSGINLSDGRPEAQQLRRSLLDYVASPAFAPTGTMAKPAFDALFRDARSDLPPRPAQFANAVAYFECAALRAARSGDISWRKRLDRAELTAGSYTLIGKNLRTWADKDGKYWVGDSLTLTLSGATNIRGKLLVRFRDPDAGTRTATGTFDGARTFTIPKHGKSKNNPEGAYWLTLGVDMEDFLDGKLELNIRKTSGPNIMIDRVILLPNE